MRATVDVDDAPRVPLDAVEHALALLSIQEAVSGRQLSPDTLDSIAAILRTAGLWVCEPGAHEGALGLACADCGAPLRR